MDNFFCWLIIRFLEPPSLLITVSCNDVMIYMLLITSVSAIFIMKALQWLAVQCTSSRLVANFLFYYFIAHEEGLVSSNGQTSVSLFTDWKVIMKWFSGYNAVWIVGISRCLDQPWSLINTLFFRPVLWISETS